MCRKRAFTLIELLVVIAIIALLMSILMPALAKAKKQALAVACMATYHQVAVITSSYTNDNDGKANAREVGAHYEKLWPYVYKPFYKDKKMRFCSVAVNPKRFTGSFGTWNYGMGSYFPLPEFPMPGEREFQPFQGQPQYGTYADGYYTGSIGLNRFFEDMQGSFSKDPAFWRRTDVKGSDKVPVFLDCMYLYYMTGNEAEPPLYDGAFLNEMQWLCINRHMGYINGLFLDWSARKVGLKELWTLKWNRTSDTCGPWTKCGKVVPNDWPKWMRGFKDY